MTSDPIDAGEALEDAFWLACDDLLMHHTNPWELDEALTGFGFAFGPCEAQDHVGLDRVLGRFDGRGSPILQRMVAEGRMGKIGGVGYYRYPGGGGAVIDPLIEDLILEEAWFGKVKRTELTDAELVARVIGALRDVVDKVSMRCNLAREDIKHLLASRIHYPTSKIAEI